MTTQTQSAQLIATSRFQLSPQERADIEHAISHYPDARAAASLPGVRLGGRRSKATDANDMLYYYRAIEDYNPAPHLAKITAPLLAINSADDLVNPPELDNVGPLLEKVPGARFVLLPIPLADTMPIFTPDELMAGSLPSGEVVVYDDDHYYMASVLAEPVP